MVWAVGALGVAPAHAAPACADIGPNTRLCRTPGHTGIVTSPDPAFTNPYPGWGFGTPGTPGFLGTSGFGLGGGGVWIGF